MIALDTNVFVRFLVEDDVKQSASAAALIERATSADASLYVSDIVVCEVVWVLASAYGVARAQIVALLRDLFRARHLEFDAPDRLTRALAAFATAKGDFADYLIREHARGAGCDRVATFDRALVREESGFVAPA